VANIVGFPTSFIAYIAACLNGNRFILKCLCMFSAMMTIDRRSPPQIPGQIV
jgi:hypothetical protein